MYYCRLKYPEIYLLWKRERERGVKVGQVMVELSIFIVVKSNYAKMEIVALTRHERMLFQFRDPFFCRMDDVPDFLAGLLVESSFVLRLFHLIEVAWVYGAHDVEEELS